LNRHVNVIELLCTNGVGSGQRISQLLLSGVLSSFISPYFLFCGFLGA